LVAKDVIDDDMVVEFYSATALTDNVTYYVYKIVYDNAYGSDDGGIVDYAGNQVFVADVMSADLEFDGTSEEHEAVELDSYSQIDAKTFELVFPREVVINKATANTTLGAFDVKYESAGVTADDKIRLVKKIGVIKEDEEYVFDLGDILKDKHGFAVANDEDDPDASPAIHRTELTGEYTDEDAPYVDDVVARDREWIKVIFNERMDESALKTTTFTLKNYDLDKPIGIKDVKKDTLDDGIIYLQVSKPLEARYEYELTLVNNDDLKDFAGFKAEKDTYYFDGTNIPTYGSLKN